MGQFIVGVDTPKVVRDPAAIAVVELLDDWTTRNLSKDHAIREVVAVRAMPPDLPMQAVVGQVADAVAGLGPHVRVVYDAAGSDTIVRAFKDAQRAGRFASYPQGVHVTPGDGMGVSDDGRLAIGQTELTRSLLEMVRTAGFEYDPDAAEGIEDLIREAVLMEAQLSPTGRLQVTTRDHADRVTALGLALYPRFHLSHAGRRYKAQLDFGTFESFTAAEGAIGQAARG